MLRYISLVVIACLLAGCAPGMEFSKKMWGSSTRSLEEARVNAIVHVYNASVERCYEEALKAAEEAEYYVFIQNKAKATIVLMKIKGSVDTTRVGIFFSEVADNQTKVFVSSLSSNAKRIVAEQIFSRMDTVLGSSSNQSVTVINEQ